MCSAKWRIAKFQSGWTVMFPLGYRPYGEFVEGMGSNNWKDAMECFKELFGEWQSLAMAGQSQAQR